MLIVQATESVTYVDSTFNSHYTGATGAGLFAGGYHFAAPSDSSGASQAEHFVANGGGWTGNGLTLPGMLDIEYNPYGSECYGLSQSAMVSWIQDFVNTYNSLVGRPPMIYSTADWWDTCTGGSTAFAQSCPLVVADYASSLGIIPGGWSHPNFWQNSDNYAYGGDSDLWYGSEADLQKFATGG